MAELVGIIYLSFATSASALALLSLGAWPGRRTRVGRAYLGLVAFSTAAALLYLLGFNQAHEPDLRSAMVGFLVMVGASLAFRVSALAAASGSKLSPRVEALIWSAPVILCAVASPVVVAAWSSIVFAMAGHRWLQIPLRSWPGFTTARTAAAIGSACPGVATFLFAAGVATPFVAILAPLLVAMQGLILYYAFPRLGLASADQVQSSSIIEAMGDGVLVVDMQGRVVDFNQAAREILELDESVASRRHLSDALSHHPDLVELMSGAIDGRTVYTPTHTDSEGPPSTYDLQISALNDSMGSIVSRVVVLRDISDRIEIEEENRRQAGHVRLIHESSAAVHEARTIDDGIEAALSLISRMIDAQVGQFLESRELDGVARLVPSRACFVDSSLEDAGQIEDALASLTTSSIIAVGTAAGDKLEAGAGAPDSDPAARPDGWWRGTAYRTVLTVPIVIGPKLYGLCEFFSAAPRKVESDTCELLDHVGVLVGRAVERKLAEEKIRRLAYRDDLTGLPNRQRFHQLLSGAISQARRSKRRMALLFLDLDGFKQVNDTMGHEVGDHLLAEVARRFSNVVRRSDHLSRDLDADAESAISRLGGDEFTVVLTEIKKPADAALVAERLLATLETPILLAGQELFIGTSIGIGIYPEDGLESDRLLRNADAAMYFAKGRGRNGYQFYSEELNRDQARNLEVESRLRGALERGDFELFYQPLLSSETGQVVAAEALLRWRDEELGFVSPEIFIPVAEESGLIVPLGAWVFRTACDQARLWRDAGHRPIRIGVNVSGHQIREPGMVEMVRCALTETGVAPQQVELEITESTIMQDDGLTVKTLGDLKEMGVGLSLDDFGTGYSSLSYLRRFTIDRVKIDRSFVNELPGNSGDAALTSAIIAMAHGMQLKVVAEGVETEGQALFLESRGCDELQGYLFGRPSPADEFVELLLADRKPLRELEKESETIDVEATD